MATPRRPRRREKTASLASLGLGGPPSKVLPSWGTLACRRPWRFRRYLVLSDFSTVGLTAQSKFHPDRSKRPIVSSEVHVVDGDTIRIRQKKPDVRLVGFNAPETGDRAICPAERELGAIATRRLRELVQTGNLEFHLVDCPAFLPGTQLTPVCNHGRHCGTLIANGRDVGITLIAEGLAVPFKCGATSCPPTPKPWCKSIGPPTKL
jgi:endonuclease YncB( thermonuclease family)